MRLQIFESDMGDCLLLEAATGELMLCDGGMKGSLRDHVRAELTKLRTAHREIALVYVSHIDNDHISGILQLLEDEAEWRVFDHHQGGASPIRPPRVPRPPVIKGILHNAFLDTKTKNNKAIQNLLIAAAPALFATAVPPLVGAADEMQGIAAGIPEGLEVLGLVGTAALNIPVNKPPGVAAGAKLLFAGQPGDAFALGSMQFTLVGPTRNELTRLRQGWNTWVSDPANLEQIKAIRAELRKRIEDFSNGALAGSPYDLGSWNGIPDIKGVTAPNVASLMFMVEENGKRLLLTGDGQPDLILDGLTRTGFLAAGSVHLDVLKVQHHGAKANLDPKFARHVSADNYVFCGNGSHGNPETDVLDIVFQSRVGSAAVRTLAPQAQNRDFHFWFSTTSQAAPAGLVRRQTFARMETHVAGLQASSGGRLHLHFNQGAFTTLPI